MNVWDFADDVRTALEMEDFDVVKHGLDLLVTDADGDEFVLNIDNADEQ